MTGEFPLNNAQTLIKDFKKANELLLNEVKNNGKKVLAACVSVNKSWSGSCAGYHSRLYFESFEEPDSQNRFSIEWGCVWNGVPRGWAEKRSDEVKKKIEALSGVSIDKLNKKIEELDLKIRDLHSEIIISLSTISWGKNTQKEEKLFEGIEKFKFGATEAKFLNGKTPRQVATRDSEAIHQGIFLPVHFNYEALAFRGVTLCDSMDDFDRSVNRLIRQVAAKKINDKKPRNYWNFVNPSWLLWQLLTRIVVLLRFAWKYKFITGILVVFTLLVADYSVAWANLRQVMNVLGFIEADVQLCKLGNEFLIEKFFSPFCR